MKFNELCECCKSYDDTWNINCFCNECQKKILENDGKIE